MKRVLEVMGARVQESIRERPSLEPESIDSIIHAEKEQLRLAKAELAAKMERLPYIRINIQ